MGNSSSVLVGSVIVTTIVVAAGAVILEQINQRLEAICTATQESQKGMKACGWSFENLSRIKKRWPTRDTAVPTKLLRTKNSEFPVEVSFRRFQMKNPQIVTEVDPILIKSFQIVTQLLEVASSICNGVDEVFVADELRTLKGSIETGVMKL